jgi:hypothetical protein
MKHTPSPWTLQRKATNHQHLIGPEPGLIADIHRDEDAVLIAAAPDLLAALQQIADGCERRLRKGHDDGDAASLDIARAAIAKAERSI